MSWVAVAIVGGAAIGATATVMGAEEVSEATEAASEATQAQYEQTRIDQEPWRIAGEKALQTIQETPEFEFSAQDFEQMKDPSYEFRMEEGINALDRSAASRGRVLSGAQDRAVTRYASDLASQEYGNAFNRSLATYQQNLGTQQSLAGIGQTAVTQTAQAGQTAVAQQNALTMQSAEATANMYGDIGQSVNQATGNYLLYNTLLPTPTTGG